MAAGMAGWGDGSWKAGARRVTIQGSFDAAGNAIAAGAKRAGEGLRRERAAGMAGMPAEMASWGIISSS